MFNLNDNSLVGGGAVVFNNGIAGKVENVKISVEKRSADQPESNPIYKVFFTDGNGAQMNQGFFYHKNNDMYSAEKNKANEGYLVGRILSIAKAVVAEDFVFPDVTGKTVNEIVDILFAIIKENCEGKLVNVFTTYGTKQKPSQYLGLRFFNSVESPNVSYSRLTPKGDDMMERITADAPKENGSAPSGASIW